MNDIFMAMGITQKPQEVMGTDVPTLVDNDNDTALQENQHDSQG